MNAAFDLSESKLSPPAGASGDRRTVRAGGSAQRRRGTGGPVRGRPGRLRQVDAPGPVGRAAATPGGMGLGRRARQRPCGPAHVPRCRPRSHRAPRTGRVPRLGFAHRRRHGSHAARVRDRGDGPAGAARHRPPGADHRAAEPRRGRPARPPPPAPSPASPSARATGCPCRRPGCGRRAGSWRSARTTWRWTGRRRRRCSQVPASRSPTATSTSSSGAPKGGRSASISAHSPSRPAAGRPRRVPA